MSRVELKIYYKQNNVAKLRCVVNKWKFQDAMMGEQFITFTITSEKPIDWAVGDFCEFRGETFTLNYVPTVTQKARTKERQDAYTYENVKFESQQEELTRILMLDITPTTGDYVAALGTNYTGSSKFQLFCGETTANGSTLTAVCALAAKMQANLDRAFQTNGWKIFVDTTSTYVNASGDTVLVTHTEDKVMSFDNTTVAQALAEVHNTFDLDYCIRGRNIYIGYNLQNLTSDNANETFVFGYGKGYPTHEDSGKALFQIKRISNTQQKIVTRLRALGSTKNMPYRFYNKKYNLSQSLFPTNLQLPDTFASPSVKATNNAQRDSLYGINALTGLPYVRHVKGDTNDAYIDKNDDAENCAEGIREESARWDGSNGDLPEIYPTIEEATYGELRGALVQDQDGRTGVSSFPGYGADERVDELLAIGYQSDGAQVDDANTGDGILPESGTTGTGTPRSATIGQTSVRYNSRNYGDFTYNGGYLVGTEKTLFTVQNVFAGKYAMAPTIGAVFYGFSLSCYKDGVSADVGFRITIKQKSKSSGNTATVATYVSDFTHITRADNIKEMELPEIPDVKNGNNAKVREIAVSELSDIIVTFAPIMRNVTVPNGFTDDFSLSYKVGNSRLGNGNNYSPEYTWISADGDESQEESFHVFIKDMGFDITACWTDETPVVAMKSGRCVGREFEIGENVEKVTYNGKKGYMLTLHRAKDTSLNTYYPSATDPIAAGDNFVLLNISMPDAYVKMAEVRLLRAATDYLADNCETQFTYQPYIDDIYLQRNYDNMVAAGTPQDSIFWRLYAGLKFTFRGIPSNENDPLPLADLTIEQVTIQMGEGLTPKVEMTLNDDVQQTTLQKLTTSVDRIYNGSLFSNGSGGAGTGANAAALLSILQSEGGKLFLSKKYDDEADGKITFKDVDTHEAMSKFKKGLKVGNFQSRLLGSGAIIDEDGNAEFESIYSRNFISTPEFRFNRIAVTEGEQWCTNGFGTILEVEQIDATTGYITLKLEENDYASVAEGDICRGIYNDIASQYETATLDDDSALYGSDPEEESDGEEEEEEEEVGVINPKEGTGFGFSCKDGFFTSYFWIKQMVVNKRGECKFMYELRNTKTPHPCEFMKFAQYGSFTNSQRRSSSYATSIGHYYEMVLDGVSTWKIKSANVVYRKGYLGNMTVTLRNGHEAELQGYGLYVQDNVYFGNAIVQLDPETLADIESALANYIVEFSEHVDVITVDDVGNAIGGLYTVDGTTRSYRIQSAITVRNNNNILTIADDNEDAGDGTYKIYAQPNGCTCVIDNSTIYITGINNIKDGVAGSQDDANFDYDAMRNMDSCSVDLIIDCEGKGSIVKSFPIRIKHDSQPFVSADIDNEFSAVSWNTQAQAYVGLPLVANMRMWHNNETLDVTSIAVNGVAGATINDSPKQITVGGITMRTGVVPRTENGKTYYIGRIQISSLPEDLSLVTNLNITTTAIYAGVPYERTLVHTINKSTDTNVYQLLPSVTEVGVGYNDNKQPIISTNKVYCTVRCDSTDDKHYTVATSDYATHGLFITYQTFSLNANDVEVGSAETAYSSLNGVTVTTDLTRIRFKLYKLRDTTLGTLEALLASANVIEVLDVEDVPVLLDGLDGDNSIFVSLDNQNDAVMCIEDGTVIASTLPTAKARLMDGEDTVGRSVLGTTLAANKQTLGNWSLVCHGCTAEFVGWVADSDSNDWVQIRVTGVTSDVASVDVNCEYTKHGVAGNYVSILSVKKIYGLDKYELVFNPPIVSYNPNTDTYTPESFMVYVWKTTQEEDRHLMTSLPGNTANAVSEQDGSIRLQYSVNKGVSWTTLYGYSSGKSIGKTLFDIAGVESVDFRIQKYVAGESGGEWVLLDEEGVEIVGDGENTVQLTIDNGNDTVMCIEDGTVIASTLPIAQVYLYDGNNLMNTDLAASAWQTLVCDGCTAEWVSGYQQDGGKRFRVTAVTSDVAKVTAQVSYKGNTYSVVHNIKKLYGLDKYEIITDPVSIAYNPNSGTHTPTSFNVYVYLTTQEEDRHLMTTLPSHSSATDGDVRLQYSTDNGSNWTTLTGYSSGKTITSSSFSSVTSGSVLLRIQKYVAGESGGEWVLLDEEGVEITRGGQDGKGVEYIFFQQDSETPRPTINDVAANRQVDNYCPYNTAGTQQWTDEPVGVGANSKFEFYAQRKKVNGVWQAFGTVKLWNRYTVDGVTPYMMDLSNEQSFINCNYDGSVLSGATYETSRLMLFKGGSYAFTDFNITITPVNVTCNGNTSAFSLTESQKTTAQSNGYFTLTPSAITANSAQISIQATLKTNSSIVLVAVYKINKNIAGQNGVIYELLPTLNVVHKDNAGNFIDTYLSLAVKKIVGTSVDTLDSIAEWDAEGFVLKYSRGSSSTQNTLGTFTNLSTSTLFGSDTRITIYLYNGSNVLLDKESINIVVDGDDGDDGEDAHEVNPNILLRTVFNNGLDFVKEAWVSNWTYTGIDAATDTIIEGRKSIRINAVNASSYVDFKQDVYGRVKAGTWYTLSFCYFATQAFNTFIYSNSNSYACIDQSAGIYIDGVLQSTVPQDGNVQWAANWQGNRHTITFKTKSSFDTTYFYIIFRAQVGGQVAICMPKLEIGEAATAYMANEDDLPGSNYYLTSDVNVIVKDYLGNFKGSATPVITAWKKTGSSAATRLADIVVNGVVAEGFTIYEREMRGDTQRYEKTSSTGVLTCAQPYSDVDRIEVLLMKNNKTYATMAIHIVQEVRGEAGADGVYPRDCGLFKSGNTYYYKKEGNMYVRDMVRYEIGGVMYGFLVKDTTVGTTGVTAAPTSASGDSNWEVSGIVATVIANTVFGTNANIGGFMASANKMRSSTVLYRIRYKGTFNSSTVYAYTTAESQSDNIPKRDMVKYGSAYYVILHQGNWTNSNGQTVSGNYIPATSTYMAPYYNEYWRKATAKEIEAVTYDSNGNEQTGGTIDFPMFELNGAKGLIRLTQSEETSWFVDERGVQTVGMEDGQRVEISPLEKKINIFDSSNKQVAQFDGDKVSSIDSLFGNSSGSLGGNDGFSGNHYESPPSGWHSGYVEGVEILGTFTSFSGMLTIVANGTITAQGNYHYSSSYYDGDPAAILIGGVPAPEKSGNSYVFKNHVIGKLVVGYESGGKFITVSVLAEVDTLGGYNQKAINVSKNITGNSSITYKLAISYKVGLYYNQSANRGGVTWSGIKVTYAGGSYLSRIFANGFVYGLNGANFMAAVAETISGATHMHVKAMSGGGMYGFEVSKDGLYVWISGTKYKVTVSGTNAVLTAQ